MEIVAADDKFFFTDAGKKIAKNALSDKKRKDYEYKLVSSSEASNPYSAPNYTIQPASRTIPQPGDKQVAPGVWDQEASGKITDVNQLMAPTPSTANNPGIGTLPGAERDQAARLIENGLVGGTPVLPQPANGPFPVQPQNNVQRAPSPVLDTMGMYAKTLPYGEMTALPGKIMEGISDAQELGESSIALTKAAMDEQNAELQKLTPSYEGSLAMYEWDAMKKADAYEKKAAELYEQFDEATKEAEDLQDINPNRYLENMSTGRQIMAGIGLVVGHIGAAMTGQTFKGIEIIENAIDRDIAAQKENRAKAYNKLNAVQKRIEMLGNRFDNDMQRDMWKKGLIMEAYKRKVDQIGMQTNNKLTTAKANELSAGLASRISELRMKFVDNSLKSAADFAKLDLARIQELEKQTGAKYSPEQIKTIEMLSNSYGKSDYIKSYRALSNAFNKMNNLASIAQKNPNAAQAIITTFNKILDEGSVVREAEVYLTMQAGSLTDKWERQMQRLREGTMTPEQTKDLINAAREIYSATTRAKGMVDQTFARKAVDYGVPSAIPLIIEMGTYSGGVPGLEVEEE